MPQLKTPTTYQQQLDILKQKNVVIGNVSQCISVLETVNYYRFTAYFLPFKQANGAYQVGTSFERVYQIYEFDRKLRSILFSALEEIEIYLRAKFAYYHAHKYGAEGYMNPDHYSHRHNAKQFHENLSREINRNSRSAFVIHHNQYYDGHFPIWVIVELFSFGMLSRFYGDMKTADQKVLSKDLYGTIPKNVISWLRCCTDLRNICAHYGRLYYRIFPATPASVPASGAAQNQLWGAVLALRALYPHPQKWNAQILLQMVALFEEYHNDIDLVHIGFPDDWFTAMQK